MADDGSGTGTPRGSWTKADVVETAVLCGGLVRRPGSLEGEEGREREEEDERESLLRGRQATAAGAPTAC